jgi:hypothetical protein
VPSTPIDQSAIGIDLSPRFIQSTAVAASPSAATETTICTLTLPSNLAVVSGVMLFGFAAFTVGTSGSACNLKLRQTNTSGATISATGATTGGISAANLVDMNVSGFDATPIAGGVYVLTLTVTAGAAASTVSATQLVAIVV